MFSKHQQLTGFTEKGRSFFSSVLFFFFPPDESYRESVPSFLIFLGLFIFISFIGFGNFFITLGGILVCVGLALQLVLSGPKSFFLYRFPILAVLIVLVYAWFAFRAFDSIDPNGGPELYKTAIYKGLSFFIGAMEIIRHPRFFKPLAVGMALCAFFHGLNGVWQYFTGFDFIKNQYAYGGRLTSTFGYRVGNVMAMLILFMFTLPWILPKNMPSYSKILITILVLVPPLFLLIFAQSRSGYLFILVASSAFFVIRYGLTKKLVVAFLLAGLLLLLVFIFGPERISLDAVMRDQRINFLWAYAVEIFKANPIIGVGVNGYNEAFASVGITPPQGVKADIEHPHNIYLQLLAETGIIGFCLYLSFLGIIIVKGWKMLRAQIKKGFESFYWFFVSIAWAGTIGYLFMAIFAHDLLRDWWFAFAMFMFGIVAGVVVSKKTEQAD